MKKIMMLGAAILAVQALPAFAEEGGPGKHGGKYGGPGKFFEKLDADKDGSVTEQEFIDGNKEKFARMDSNKDGKVTKDELDAHHAEMKKKRDAHRAEMKEKHGGVDVPPPPAAE